MKFEIEARDVSSMGNLSTKKITLSANAKAFKIIFGQIYPDIIKAIVREIFANGWDSQKKAQNLDVPIDIHLPTKLSPYFSVRDYGMGMTPDLIEEVYSRVFESTKDSSNDEVGTFGMGSKTPLGYTDSFTIMSYVDGVFWAYDIFIARDGHPVIALKATGETKEANGVEVSVAVNPGDEDTFKTYAEMYALGAGTPVNINRSRYVNSRNVLMSGDDWIMFDDDQFFMVRMGCILYAIDSSFLTAGVHNSIDRVNISHLCTLPLVIDFDIGELGVTGSREDIIYDSNSIKTITTKMLDIKKDIESRCVSHVKNCDTLEQAYKRAQFYDRNLNVREDFFWKSWNIERIDHFLNHNRLNLTYSFNNFNRNKKFKAFGMKRMMAHDLYEAGSMLYVIIENKSHKRVTRVNNRVNQLCKTVEMYRKGYNEKSNFLWVRINDEAELKRLYTVLPDHHIFINAEDIWLPPTEAKQKYVKNNEQLPNIYKATRKRYYETDKYCLSSKRDVVTGKYYIEYEKREGITGDLQEKIESVITQLNIGTDEVYVVNSKNISLVKKFKLKNIFDEYEKVRKSVDYSRDTYYYNALKDTVWYEDGWCHDIEGNIELVAQLIGHKFNKELFYNTTSVNFNKDINEKVNKKYNKIHEKLTAKAERLYKRHPLLKYLSSYIIRINMDKILKDIGEIK